MMKREDRMKNKHTAKGREYSDEAHAAALIGLPDALEEICLTQYSRAVVAMAAHYCRYCDEFGIIARDALYWNCRRLIDNLYYKKPRPVTGVELMRGRDFAALMAQLSRLNNEAYHLTASVFIGACHFGWWKAYNNALFRNAACDLNDEFFPQSYQKAAARITESMLRIELQRDRERSQKHE